ncbi:hypothetical protein ABZW38_31525 [Streptomyces bacillaris]|uniref:hypothetical protein n=1 Tax=Streptomyces bacillaris TaxID=68179 RepID=UPI00345F8D7D
MDFIAAAWSDLTAPDRADRARKAWELYDAASGDGEDSRIEDLITDLLHLADTDEHPGGAEGVAARASRNYEGELATWPTVVREAAAEPTGRFLAQARQVGGDWFTVAADDDRREAAVDLWRGMQLAGFRFSELAAHTEDLMKGYVLTSDGCEFRVIERGRDES